MAVIIEWLWNLTASIVAWFGTLFPTADQPDWFTHLDTGMNDWFAQWDGLGVWAPWGFLAVVLAFVLGWWLVGFGIKLFRVLVAHLPVSGGSG